MRELGWVEDRRHHVADPKGIGDDTMLPPHHLDLYPPEIEVVPQPVPDDQMVVGLLAGERKHIAAFKEDIDERRTPTRKAA